MSSIVPPPDNSPNDSPVQTPVKSAPVKSALESALVAIIVWGACLWFLISETQAGDIAAGRAVLFSLGMLAGLLAHWAYMGIAVKRAGRRVWLWMLLLVLTFPIASVILGVLLMSQAEEGNARAA